MCGKLCHDIENKSHIEWGKIRCIKGNTFANYEKLKEGRET